MTSLKDSSGSDSKDLIAFSTFVKSMFIFTITGIDYFVTAIRTDDFVSPTDFHKIFPCLVFGGKHLDEIQKRKSLCL